MTTIAWDGTTLAADRQAELGDIKFEEQKLRPILTAPHLASSHVIGWLVGCGRAEYTHLVARWICDRSKPEDKPDLKDGEWHGLLLINGACYLLEDNLVYMPCPDRIALGSGKQAAMTAMRLGKTAAEAVAVACTIDPGTGYGVDYVNATSTQPAFLLADRP